ncbi:uncharacterized protein ColSpa_09755 [Colletotrichum spaethianum]|uniref:DUF7871 domain-containing protein n=1 Tax=Colletotrichum spaethianum TaxID=700344 RepID=A0AA37UJF4_9PEZI|nr:uncharacterized protein ColSpa_09755 [Colletotrichum spaethianum]GKT49574.1 hypothetical protein ColSpa_09755 [Colletotrichum spaethianum]
MTVDKASTCCGKSAECVCGMYSLPTSPFVSNLENLSSMRQQQLVLLLGDIYTHFRSQHNYQNNYKLTDLSSRSAQQAKCSCGQQSALHCTCSKASTENSVAGPRCSCRARPAGECTCDRASTENTKPAGETCACGVRPANACTCDKASDGSFNPSEHETDFTTRR